MLIQLEFDLSHLATLDLHEHLINVDIKIVVQMKLTRIAYLFSPIRGRSIDCVSCLSVISQLDRECFEDISNKSLV